MSKVQRTETTKSLLSMWPPLPTPQILFFFFLVNFVLKIIYIVWDRDILDGVPEIGLEALVSAQSIQNSSSLIVSLEISVPELTSPLTFTPVSWFSALIICVTNYPKLCSLKQQTFLTSQSFWGSEICKHHSWVDLNRDLSWDCSQALRWGSCHLKAQLGQSTHFQTHSLGCWQASVPHYLLFRQDSYHTGLSIGLLTA